MAAIKNIDYSVQIVFSVKKSKRKEWLNYNVDIYSLDSDANAKAILSDLSLSDVDNLYLDAFYDPEIPLLIEGIREVLNDKSLYFSFSPVDEKDFILEFTSSVKSDNFELSFFVDKKMRNVWHGIKILVDKSEMLEFLNSLSKENEILAK